MWNWIKRLFFGPEPEYVRITLVDPTVELVKPKAAKAPAKKKPVATKKPAAKKPAAKKPAAKKPAKKVK